MALPSRTLKLVVALAALLVAPANAQAGWLQPTGSCYAKLSNRLLVGGRAYTDKGLRVFAEVPSYVDTLFSLYGECGINSWITATTSLSPVGYAKAGGNGTSYVGPLVAGIRFGLVRDGNWRLSVSARYGYAPPAGDEILSDVVFETDSGERGRAVYRPTVENTFGELTIDGGLGFTFFGAPAFASGTLGARFNRATEIDHAIVGMLMAGVTLWSQLVIDLHVSLYEPFGQDVKITNTSGAGQTRYLGFGLGVSWWFIKKRLAVFFAFDGVAYATSNAATPALMFGFETKFSLWTPNKPQPPQPQPQDKQP
ncbi:MAG: hypothetical protein KC503_26400 [Myxococcales bacterium]|nr:hypothetical protein [Myxococcales bacterium]